METLKFEDLKLSREILRAVEDMGFEEATPIQSKAIPFILKGKDLIGQAQTGTGKTASFGIPVIESIDANSKKVQAIVLCPTRELAIQVSEELGELLKYKKSIKVIPIYGGQSIERQINALKHGVNIVIGTPGRVIDHIGRGTLKLDDVKIVVLDEADEMLDMGFRDDIEEILKSVPSERQTIMFSATMPAPIMELSRKYLNHPELIKVVHKELTVPNVNQFYIELKPAMKLEVLTRLMDIHNPKLSLVFCNTKRAVDDLVSHLHARGYTADGLHGDMKQNVRDKVMSKFRTGKIEMLVATDVAARGIDVEEIDAVFNYDMPQDEEYYVHRIGRTARAGRAGQAFTFATGRDFRTLREIEKYTKTKIQRLQIPTVKDVEEVRMNLLLEEIKKGIQDEAGLERYTHFVERLMTEDYTSVEIAASLLKIILGEEKVSDAFEMEMKNGEERKERREKSGKRKFEDRKEFGRDERIQDMRDRNEDRRRDKGSKMIRMFLNVGKKQKIKPGDIVGAIAGETGIPGNAIGEIDMYDRFTFLEIPKRYSEKVTKLMKKKQIKGKKIVLQIANER